jgi:hypothetical protein
MPSTAGPSGSVTSIQVSAAQREVQVNWGSDSNSTPTPANVLYMAGFQT